MSSTPLSLQFSLLLLLIPAMAVAARGVAKPGCEEKCGNVSIPYPFGTTEGCFHDHAFHLTCNHTSGAVTTFPIGGEYGDLTVTNISLEGELYVSQHILRDCVEEKGTPVESKYSMDFKTFPNFRLSNTKNKFTAVGCSTTASMIGFGDTEDDLTYGTGCVSLCGEKKYVRNGSCSGIGCCQMSIPEGISSFRLLVSNDNETDWGEFNPCSYAFVVQEDKFNFSSKYIENMEEQKLPMVLDWAIGNMSCDEAVKSNTYACKENTSECSEVNNGPGYRCKCQPGYDGNPYLPNGCQDLDECKNSSLNDCKDICINTPGKFKCYCPKGHHGDGKKSGSGCIKNELLLVKIGVCWVAAILILLVCLYWFYVGVKKRKLIKLKEKFFRQNGGLILEQQRAKCERATTEIFNGKDLEKATNNYDESRIIGRGGFGTVYKGILVDKRIVAIKKSKIVNETQIEQFINEVVVLSQISHRNVVKLLGCCLETEVPLLVYEFITNGTLSHHIHNLDKASNISWEVRLRIATEVAGVLSYLHSAASTPIIHRDVKPSNILLDDDFTAKMSDFGASMLVPQNREELSTLVKGTLGYLDPEYMHTSQLTDKSDVYSFGVVLVELLSGKRPLCFEREEEERNLIMYFLSSLDRDCLFNVVEERVVSEGNTVQLMKVAELIKRCLRVKGVERPTMKEVAMELEGLRSGEKHPRVNFDMSLEEMERLHGENSTYRGDRRGTSITNCYDKEAASELDGGR